MQKCWHGAGELGFGINNSTSVPFSRAEMYIVYIVDTLYIHYTRGWMNIEYIYVPYVPKEVLACVCVCVCER